MITLARLFVLATCLGCSWSFQVQQSRAIHIHSLISFAPPPHNQRVHYRPAPVQTSRPSALFAVSNFITPKSLDTISVIAGFCILAAYHVQLIRKEQKGKKTWRSVQADTREQWAAHVRETQGWLYAIQTLRNAITANTFLSTTVLSLLTVITGRLWEICRTMAETTANNNGALYKLLVTQFTLVVCCMLTSAYHFLQSARLMTHAGFMFPVDHGSKRVDRVMRKSQNAQWLGLRWLYVSLGVISWIVGGPKVFFVASSVLSLFFQSIDRVPEGIEGEEGDSSL